MSGAAALPAAGRAGRMAGLPAGDRSARGRLAIAAAVVALVLAAALSLAVGATGVSLGALPRALGLVGTDGVDAATLARERLILLDIRLPRVALAILVGGGLAVSGAVMQGLFRNPLADPGIIGVSSGAALAAVTVIALGGGVLAPFVAPLGRAAVPVAAFVGGLAATAFLYRLGTRTGTTSIATLLLAGIAVDAAARALTGLVIFSADDQALRDLTFWTLGSLGGASWAKIAAAAPFVLIAAVVLPFVARALNALLLGEAEAHHLGVPVETAKRLSMLAVAAAVSAAVAVAGVIGFVGIVVPHLVRLVTGPDHRFVLPASALLGATLTLVADAVARVVVAPAELPIGIVTAAIGAPFFLWLLLRRRAGTG
jgi:iron complex transport system permease protein